MKLTSPAILASFFIVMISAPMTVAHAQTAPKWERLPDAAALAKHYPAQALAQGIEGRAAMKCEVIRADRRFGVLADCSVVEESPSDQGFGAALLSMTSMFKMRISDPKYTRGGWVVIPLVFKLPPIEPAPNAR